MPKTIIIFLAGLSLLFSSSLHAGDYRPKTSFSADMIEEGRFEGPDGESFSGSHRMKLFVSPDGIRYEIPKTDAGPAHFIIMNFSRMASWICEDTGATGMCIETPLDKEDLDYSLAGGSPCDEEDGFAATKLGRETLQGRQVEKWRCDSPEEGESYTVWVDPKLQHFVRQQDNERVTELTNIKEGSLPGSLFQPPAGYSILGMSDLLQGLGDLLR
jgi:hypothetical protein